VGHGAYGILINHGTGTTGKTVGAKVLDNTISDVEGLWAHGIGLEGNTPDAVVERNDISKLTDHKTPSDAVAVKVEDNASAATVGIHFNNFYSLSVGVQNVVDGTIVDATKNWWGSRDGPFGEGASSVSGDVDYDPWFDSAIVFTVLSSGPGLTATYTATPPPTVSISVAPTAVSFGDVAPGVAAPGDKLVTVKNTGGVDVNLSAGIVGASNPNVYTTGLTIDGSSVSGWSAGPVGVSYTTGALALVLTVPVGTDPGIYTATITFWAKAA